MTETSQRERERQRQRQRQRDRDREANRQIYGKREELNGKNENRNHLSK